MSEFSDPEPNVPGYSADGGNPYSSGGRVASQTFTLDGTYSEGLIHFQLDNDNGTTPNNIELTFPNGGDYSYRLDDGTSATGATSIHLVEFNNASSSASGWLHFSDPNGQGVQFTGTMGAGYRFGVEPALLSGNMEASSFGELTLNASGQHVVIDKMEVFTL